MIDHDYYIGLMSGTSADAVDVVATCFSGQKTTVIGTHSIPLPPDIRQKIHALATPSNNEIDQMGALDRQLGELFADAVNQMLNKHNINPDSIVAIGSHGQTIRHRPPSTTNQPFTLQIGDPNIIAERTGITTVADFRRRDMAAGGQGAPLVPAFHRAMFQRDNIDRVIVNIGGMANITWLPTSGKTIGFDTGPGNVLMDAWISEHTGKLYDIDGDWAASGTPNKQLLSRLLKHPFLALPAPKSTGRESFNLAWIKSELADIIAAPADIQATLAMLTATTIAQDIRMLTQSPCEVFICGGGAYNTHLLHNIQRLLPNAKIADTLSIGIAPEWVEAMAFAWLAKQTLEKRAGNLCAVTGATNEVILGGVYFA